MNSERIIILTHDQGGESRIAIHALEVRRTQETIKKVDITEVKWDKPLGYRVPFVVTPEGIYQGLNGIQVYIKRHAQ